MCSTIDPKGQTGIVGLSIEVKIQMDERLAILTDECDPLREATLYNLAQDFSASWLSSESMPRKRYWQQIGGVEAMMKYLTDEDQRMRLLAVYACWNFAENLEFLRCEYNLGALPHIIRFVKSEDPDEKNAGVGWLWSFLEQVELLPAMEQEGVIGILVNSIRDTRFHLQLLVGCLQSCSICPSCRKTMVDLNVIEKLTAVIKQNKELSAHYTGAHKAIHHAAITLAHLLNDDRFTERTKGVQVDETLRYFMASFTPKEIFELEKQLGYSWQNLQPFYTLCESSVPEVYQMGAFCMEFLSWDGTSGQKMVDQDIVQKLVCLSWMKNRGTKFIENINQALNNLKLYYLAPSLKQICYFKLLENHGKNLRAMLEAYHLL
jgi:hypothetical protein